MKRFLSLLCGIVALTFTALAQANNNIEPSLNAWWLDITFKPTSQTIRGIPLEKFSNDWEYAELLSCIDLSQQVSPKDIKEFKSSRFSYEKRLDLNRNGKQEQFVVGVYQRKSGVQGQFISIFEQDKLIKTFTKDGVAGFSALLIDKGQVYWSFCMQCGGHNSKKILWNGSDFALW